MEKNKEKSVSKKLETVLAYLPRTVSERVLELAVSADKGVFSISEIRLRSNGVCAVVMGGRNLPLGVRLSDGELKETLRRVSGGAMLAHRDDVRRGFISLDGGIRVGVAGHARYDGDNMVGISDISSLVFRIPTGECPFAGRLYAEWLIIGGGMLICSRAGEGKTTVIRALARLVGSGERPRRVVVVDERCELDESEYRDAHVDILRGYRRAAGVDIAIRTMSAEVLMVDEISSYDDSRAMLSAIGAGVTVIASAHAETLADAMRRGYVRELMEGGMFSTFCSIYRRGDSFSYRLEKIERDMGEMLHGMGDI